MKNIFCSIIMICFAATASAQVKPNNLPKSLNDLIQRNFKMDTSVSKLTLPTLTPNNYFKQGLMASVNAANFNSLMPVKHLSSTDNMPIAKVSANGFNMPVKVVTVNPSR